MTENKKDELFSEHLQYMGKLLKSKGTRQKEGKDIDWKVWKLNFESGKQYPWSCSAFDKISDTGVQVADMEEGKFYEVVFKNTEYQHATHGLVKSKQAVIIKNSSEDKSTAFNLGQVVVPTTTPQQSQKAVAQDWVNFVKEYREALGDEAGAVHLFGLYVLNKHEEQFSNIIALCKKEFAAKEPLKVSM